MALGLSRKPKPQIHPKLSLTKNKPREVVLFLFFPIVWHTKPTSNSEYLYVCVCASTWTWVLHKTS